MKKLNHQAARLLSLLEKLPPDLQEIEAYIKASGCSADDVTAAMVLRAETLFCECVEPKTRRYELPSENELKKYGSYYLPQLTDVALKHGLDPNLAVDGTTFLDLLNWIDLPYAAADSLNLLADSGADVSGLLCGIDDRDYGLSFSIGFDAHDQPNRRRFDARVHLWLVALGVAFKKGEESAVTCVSGFDGRKLREHWNYDFCLVYAPNDYGDPWSLRIFDKYDKWEVAVF